MIGKFIAAWGQTAATALGRSITEAIVRFDPQTASEAQILQYEQSLTELTTRVAELRNVFNKEKQEADECDAQYKRYLAAADRLQANLGTSPDGEKAKIEDSLGRLLTQLEQLKPQVVQEKQEADDAKSILDQFQDAAAKMAKQVVEARGKLKAAVSGMEKAKLAKAQAAKNAENAAVLAGVREHSDTLSTALDAMNRVAEKDKTAAAAGNLKADLLTKATPQSVEKDPLVEEALRAVSGEAKAPVTPAERLAALRA